jgi:hypothetical protein
MAVDVRRAPVTRSHPREYLPRYSVKVRDRRGWWLAVVDADRLVPKVVVRRSRAALMERVRRWSSDRGVFVLDVDPEHVEDLIRNELIIGLCEAQDEQILWGTGGPPALRGLIP